MKTKIIVLLLILGAVLLSGCTGKEKPSPEPVMNETPAETPTTNMTPVETPTTNMTPVETPTTNITTPAEVTPRDNITSPEIRKVPYVIRVEYYRAYPSKLEIKKGESVAWINFHDNPKRAFTLVSNDGLFENTTLVYKRSFEYSFQEAGTYTFSVIGQPRMNVTVEVK